MKFSLLIFLILAGGCDVIRMPIQAVEAIRIPIGHDITYRPGVEVAK